MAAATPDVCEVAGGNISARGGVQRLSAIDGYRLYGTISSELGSAPLTAMWDRPNRLRIEIGDSAESLVMATDGTDYWKLEPGPWRPEPEAMMPYERDVFMRQADFDTPLIHVNCDDPQTSEGARLIWTDYPAATIEDTSTALTYVMSITDRDSNRTFYRTDRGTRLVTWQSFETGHYGMTFTIETTFGDYRKVNGVQFPHRIERFVDGNPYDVVTVDSVVLGGDYPDSLFTMPSLPAGLSERAVTRVSSVLPLRDSFRADSGMVRLIALLSPT